MNKTTAYRPRPTPPVAPGCRVSRWLPAARQIVFSLAGFLILLIATSRAGRADSISSYSYSSTRSTYTRTTHSTPTRTSCPLQRSTRGSSATTAVPRDDGTSVKIGSGPFARNCVLYLRKERGIPLPQKDLSSFASKLSIVNSQMPAPGEVAVIRIGQGHYARIGHLAEVLSVEDNGYGATLRLREANYPTSGYYIRTIAANSLRQAEQNAGIVGYYQPL